MSKSSNDDSIAARTMEQVQQGIRKHGIRAKKRVARITRKDVANYFKRNAFVILTMMGVILGKS
ncbi:excitatory amino acid transporter 1-like [Callorhinchus milii]|uniref:Uncharacterized protein n=1 Tax=Callorhinchus milii TaxID=7868 RepID=A0A4W3H6K0_CALMI|nr:excitatory amino acid transporter 1-like [Callorhinchus milii]